MTPAWGQPDMAHAFVGPTAVAHSPSDGRLYVLDTDANRVVILDAAGLYVGSFGSGGTADDQFNVPEDIALDSAGNVYVTDRNNIAVKVFDHDGTFVRKFGSLRAPNPEQFAHWPIGRRHRTGRQGLRDRSRTSRGWCGLNPMGPSSTRSGPPGPRPSRVRPRPTSIAIEADGDIYVVDRDNKRIEVFNYDPPDDPPPPPLRATTGTISGVVVRRHRAAARRRAGRGLPE